MDYVVILGLVAATFTTLAYLPQAIKAWRTRSTKDLSFGMFLMFAIGVSLWLIYGILIKDIPLIAANAVTSVLAFSILIMKIRYG